MIAQLTFEATLKNHERHPQFTDTRIFLLFDPPWAPFGEQIAIDRPIGHCRGAFDIMDRPGLDQASLDIGRSRHAVHGDGRAGLHRQLSDHTLVDRHVALDRGDRHIRDCIDRDVADDVIVGDVHKAAEVFHKLEVEPLKARLRELNDWLGIEVVRFRDYEPPAQ